MARVQKRGSGYIVKYRMPDGKDRSKGGFRTKKLADAFAVKVEDAKLRGLVFDHKAGEMLLRDAAQLFIESRHDLKPRTMAGYREMLAPADERRRDMRELGIDATFGGYPLNRITREDISAWVQKLVDAGKASSTIRHQFFLLRMILAQAVVDCRLVVNPAQYVKIPTDRSITGGKQGVVDDPKQFLTAEQVDALVEAAPWPYNIYIHLAGWSGLRAGELCGLQIRDVALPAPNINPNARAKPGLLNVERTVQRIDGELAYTTPKTMNSRRRVPLTAATTEILREYLRIHPRRDEPMAPLFPGMRLTVPRPTGVKNDDDPNEVLKVPGIEPGSWRIIADRNTTALANLSVDDAEARLVLDWGSVLRHMTVYKAVFKPAILRANRLAPTAKIDPETVFHSLRHTYVSLAVAAGIPAMEISRFVGHSKVTTTLGIYAHLFESDHSDAMTALGAMAQNPERSANVIPLRG